MLKIDVLRDLLEIFQNKMSEFFKYFSFSVSLIIKFFSLLLAILCFLGCSSLVLEERTPVETHFSGRWILNVPLSEILEPDSSRENEDSSVRIFSKEIMRPNVADPFVFISHDFHVLDAKKISVELGLISAGLDYSPGVYRDVTFGQRRRGLWHVYAGWEDKELVIVSKADGLNVIERFAMLNPDRMRVVVNVRVEKEERRVVKVFDRSP